MTLSITDQKRKKMYMRSAGHSGITHDQWTDTVCGIALGNFLGGVSLGWWKKVHRTLSFPYT
jgi:hypothetical protein